MIDILKWNDILNRWDHMMIDPTHIVAAIKYDDSRTNVKIGNEWILVKATIDSILAIKKAYNFN